MNKESRNCESDVLCGHAPAALLGRERTSVSVRFIISSGLASISTEGRRLLWASERYYCDCIKYNPDTRSEIASRLDEVPRGIVWGHRF